MKSIAQTFAFATLGYLTAMAQGQDVALEKGWATSLVLELSNDYDDFSGSSCPEEAFDHLRAEMFMWLKDELLSVFGQDKFYNLSELRFVNEDHVLAKKVEFEADFDCLLCGKRQWSTDQSIHNVAYILQWFLHAELNEWIEENEEILEGCMEGDIHLDLFIKKQGIAPKVFQADKSKFSKSALKTISLMQK